MSMSMSMSMGMSMSMSVSTGRCRAADLRALGDDALGVVLQLEDLKVGRDRRLRPKLALM